MYPGADCTCAATSSRGDMAPPRCWARARTAASIARMAASTRCSSSGAALGAAYHPSALGVVYGRRCASCPTPGTMGALYAASIAARTAARSTGAMTKGRSGPPLANTAARAPACRPETVRPAWSATMTWEAMWAATAPALASASSPTGAAARRRAAATAAAAAARGACRRLSSAVAAASATFCTAATCRLNSSFRRPRGDVPRCAPGARMTSASRRWPAARAPLERRTAPRGPGVAPIGGSCGRRSRTLSSAATSALPRASSAGRCCTMAAFTSAGVAAGSAP